MGEKEPKLKIFAPETESEQKQELVKKMEIYDNPSYDPVVSKTEKEILEITNQDPQVKKSMDDKKYKGLDSYHAVHDRVFGRVSMQKWDNFIKGYPEKAEAYRNKLESIEDAFKREEKRKATVVEKEKPDEFEELEVKIDKTMEEWKKEDAKAIEEEKAKLDKLFEQEEPKKEE